MKTIELKNATGTLAEYARRAAREPLIVMASGKPVAALVPISRADLETTSLSTNPQFVAILERSWDRLTKEGGIPSEEMRRRLRTRR